jgi:hypothetical protein
MAVAIPLPETITIGTLLGVFMTLKKLGLIKFNIGKNSGKAINNGSPFNPNSCPIGIEVKREIKDLKENTAEIKQDVRELRNTQRDIASGVSYIRGRIDKGI